MATLRKIPFGYKFIKGKAVCDTYESDIVVRIYNQYAAGMSYKQLADSLNEQGVIYNIGQVWNKNTVARILQDMRYSDGSYPVIIDPELREKVNEKLGQKSDGISKLSESTRYINKVCYCGSCGAKMVRKHYLKNWYCKSCEDIKTAESEIEIKVQNILHKLCGEPETIIAPETDKISPTIINKLQEQIDAELKTKNRNEDKVTQLVLKLTSERFAQYNSYGYETERLQRLFAATDESDINLAEILPQAVAKVMVYPQDNISIVLKNNQEFSFRET